MSLIAWYPFTKDGTPAIKPIDGGNVVNGQFIDGFMGKCLDTGTNTYDLNLIDTEHWKYFSDSITISAWFKFNKASIETVLNALTISSKNNSYACGNLLGNHSYGGLAIYYTSNNMFNTTTGERIADFSQLRIYAGLRGYTPDLNVSGKKVNYILTIASPYTVIFDEWVHVSLVLNKEEGSMIMYINGKEHSRVKNGIDYNKMLAHANKNWPINKSFGINRQQVYGGNGPSKAIPFNICDLRIYDHALTQFELEELSKACMVDINFNDPYIQNTTNFLADKTISGHGSSWTLQNEKYLGYPIYKNTVTSPDTGNNAGFRYTLAFDYPFVTDETNRIFTISFWKRLNTVYGKNLAGYIRFVKEDGTNTTASWSYSKSNWANDANSIGKWEYITAKATLPVGITITKFSCFYVYVDRAPSGDCDYSQIQIEHSSQASPYVETSRIDYPIYDSSGYNHHAWHKNCNLTTDTGSGSYALSTVGIPNATTPAAKQQFCRIDMGQNIYLDKFTVMMMVYKIADGHQTSGVLSTSLYNQTSSGSSDYMTSPLRQYDGNYRLRGKDTDGNAAVTNISSSVLPTGAWYHLCFVYNGTQFIVYRNGVAVQTASTTVRSPYPFRYFYLGLDGAGGAYRNATAKYADFKLYGTALSADDIKFLYESYAILDNKGRLYADEFIEEDESASEIASWYRTSRANQFVEALTDGYTALEYIESSGSQYIDTGYSFNSENAEIYADINVLSNASNQSLWGNEEYTASSGNSRSFSLIPHGKNGSFSIYTGSSSAGSISIGLNTRRSVRLKALNNKYTYYVDEIQAASGNYAGTIQSKSTCYINSTTYLSSIGNIYLFANHNSNRGTTTYAHQQVGAMRLYAFTIYDDGIKVRDFIPCKRNSDNTIGLYDQVEGKFYSSPNNEAFISGAELRYPGYRRIEYLESTKTQYINTKYVPQVNNVSIELDFEWTGTSDKVSIWEALAGFMQSTSIVTPRLGVHKYNGVWMFGANATASSDIAPVPNERIILRADFKSSLNKLYKNGTLIVSDATSFNFASSTAPNTCPIYLFARYCSGSENPAQIKLYNAKIYENDILIRNYIPVQRKTDNLNGLYDTIGNLFYSSITSTDFDGGESLEEEYEICEVYEHSINTYEIIEK